MPLYEHIFMARQDVSQAQVEALIKEFADVVTAGGGKIGKTEYWGLKNLAYKIKKNRKAHYSLMNIEAPPAAIAEMERRMGLSTDVLRFMTIKVEQHETEMSIQMRKQDRDDRDRDRGFGDRGGRGFGGGGRDRGRGFGERDRDRGPRPDRPPMGAGAGSPPPAGGVAADRSTFRPRPRPDAAGKE